MLTKSIANTEIIERLGPGLVYLWSRPLLQLSRKLEKLMGKSREWPQLYELAAASPADYPIVRHPIADIIGRTIFHVAVCRSPRR